MVEVDGEGSIETALPGESVQDPVPSGHHKLVAHAQYVHHAPDDGRLAEVLDLNHLHLSPTPCTLQLLTRLTRTVWERKYRVVQPPLGPVRMVLIRGVASFQGFGMTILLYSGHSRNNNL